MCLHPPGKGDAADECADKLKRRKQCEACGDVVEVTGFEPAAFWSRTKRATKLRYTSKTTLTIRD